MDVGVTIREAENRGLNVEVLVERRVEVRAELDVPDFVERRLYVDDVELDGVFVGRLDHEPVFVNRIESDTLPEPD